MSKDINTYRIGLKLVSGEVVNDNLLEREIQSILDIFRNRNTTFFKFDSKLINKNSIVYIEGVNEFELDLKF